MGKYLFEENKKYQFNIPGTGQITANKDFSVNVTEEGDTDYKTWIATVDDQSRTGLYNFKLWKDSEAGVTHYLGPGPEFLDAKAKDLQDPQSVDFNDQNQGSDGDDPTIWYFFITPSPLAVQLVDVDGTKKLKPLASGTSDTKFQITKLPPDQ